MNERIAIVTDSTADIPIDLLRGYGNIHVVPAVLVIDGLNINDGEGISREMFYQRLPRMANLPTTSAPAVGSFQQLYERLFQQGFSRILSIHAAALLSGIFNAARVAAQSFDDQVLVMDSGQLTLGLGFQVLAAAEAIKNALPWQAIMDCIADVRRRIHLVAMLDTLEYVRRSGRVSWARARVGELLRIKPFLGLKDGVVLRFGEAHTRRKGFERLAEMIHRLGALEYLAVLHTNAESDARSLLASVKQQVTHTPFIVNVTTIIGTHVGPNGLGFVAVPHS